MFRNQGPDYYGDGDEGDADLLEEEERYARQGTSPHPDLWLRIHMCRDGC